MRRAVYACAAAAAFISAYTSALWLRPDITLGSGFLFGDEGNNLWLAAVAAAGGRVPVDAFTPYGPFNTWIYVAAAHAGGNSPLTFRVLLLLLNTAALLLLCLAFARYMRPSLAALWSVGAMTPMMLGLGPLLGGLTVAAYTGLDRIFMAGTLLVWRAPDERSARRSFAAGALCGACQWNRFGPAAVVLAGLVIADLAGGRRRIRATLWMVAGAAAVELAFAAWAFASLPGRLALDTVWPAYLLESYTTLAPGMRWPPLSNPAALFGHYGPAVAGAGVAAVMLRRTQLASSQRLALALLAAYAIGAVTIFRSEYHFRQFAWWLAAAGGFAGASLQWSWRAAVLAVCLPAWVVIARTLNAEAAPVRWMTTPAAGRVAISELDQQRLDALERLRGEAQSRGRHVLLAPTGAGWHAAFGVPAPGRHVWFLPGNLRPWDEAPLRDALGRFDAIAMCPDRGGGLEPSLLRAAGAMFPVATRSADCAVFRREQ